MAGSAEATLAAVRLRVMRIVPVLVCVGSATAIHSPSAPSCVMTAAFWLQVMRSTVRLLLVQKLAATTLREVSLTACTLVEFSRILIWGLAA